MDELQIIHEYSLAEMPKRRLLALFKAGARLYKICENQACEQFEEYQEITSDQELMTYCLKCARKVLRYGVEKG